MCLRNKIMIYTSLTKLVQNMLQLAQLSGFWWLICGYGFSNVGDTEATYPTSPEGSSSVIKRSKMQNPPAKWRFSMGISFIICVCFNRIFHDYHELLLGKTSFLLILLIPCLITTGYLAVGLIFLPSYVSYMGQRNTDCKPRLRTTSPQVTKECKGNWAMQSN